MNALGREVFRAAALANRAQAYGKPRDRGDAVCAALLLAEHLGVDDDLGSLIDSRRAASAFEVALAAVYRVYDLGRDRDRATCPECAEVVLNEYALLQHLNDIHQLDWLGLATKMPVSDAGGP